MTPEPSAKPPKPRWRRWLWRVVKWGGLLLLVLVIFHRPILRFALDKGAKHFAGNMGMEMQWDVDGTVVGGVDLQNIKVTGGAEAPVKSLTAKRIYADYSVARIFSDGVGQFVDEVVLEDVELDLDPAKFPKGPEKPKKEPAAPPKVKLPKVRLANVNVRVRLPQGDLVLRGLHFTLNRDAAGALSFDELQLPNKNLPVLKNVQGTTETAEQRFTLKSLTVLPDLDVQSLTVDLNRLPEKMIAFNAALKVPGGVVTEQKAAGSSPAQVVVGHGTVEAQGTLSGLGEQPVLEAQVKCAALNAATLSPWVKLPPDLAWQVEDFTASVKGRVDKPRELQATLSLNGSGVRAGGVKLDRVKVEGTLQNGALAVKATDIAAGSNKLIATVTGTLPEDWKDAGQMELKADADVNFPQVAELFTQNPPLTGALTGKLTATFSGGQLAQAKAALSGTQINVQGVPVESVELNAVTDGKAVTLEKLRAALDANNTVEATATLGLTGDRVLNAEWTAKLPNLEKLGAFSGRKDMPGPDGGSLHGGGKVSGALADWQRQDFSKTTADVKLEAGGVKWKSGALQSLSLSATVAEGRAELQKFVAVLNERNQLSATGSGAIAKPFTFAAKVDGDLSQLTDLNGWLESVGAQKILAGKAKIQWEGSGQAEPFTLTGGGAVTVENFKAPGMKEAAAVTLKTSHSGRRADVSVLEASLGTLKLSAPCVVTDTGFEIPALTVKAGNLPPVTGAVKVPLDFNQQGGPAGPVAKNGALDVTLNVKQLDLAEAARAAGQKADTKGKVDADVKITGTLLNPSAVIAVKASGVSSSAVKQKLSPADAVVNVTLRDRRMEAKVEVTQKPLQKLTASGSAPVDVQKLLANPNTLKDTPLNFDITLPNSDLNGLRQFVDSISSMKGTFGLNAKVGGTIGKPSIRGELRADSPAIAFKKPDVPDARNVKLRVRFDGTKVFIDEAGAMLAGGTVGAKGQVDWTDSANPRIDATLTAREALVLRDDSISQRANADIAVRGSLQQANVTGRVELVRGRVFKEIEFLPLSLPNQLPPAPPAVNVGSKEPPSLPPPFDKWNLNVDIVTKDPVRLLGNVLNGGVISDLHLRGTGAMMALEGKVSLKDARVRLPFSRMTITRGDVVFTKEKPFNPDLDLLGDSFVNGYQVQLQGYGSALNPKIRFSSSPPLPEGEIATLLATGSTSGEMRASEGEAANRAAFLLVSQMYRKLFRKNVVSKENDDPPRLTFSFSLLNNSSGTRSFSAIYEINNKLQAVGAMGQNGSFRGLLYYLIRFR